MRELVIKLWSQYYLQFFSSLNVIWSIPVKKHSFCLPGCGQFGVIGTCDDLQILSIYLNIQVQTWDKKTSLSSVDLVIIWSWPGHSVDPKLDKYQNQRSSIQISGLIFFIDSRAWPCCSLDLQGVPKKNGDLERFWVFDLRRGVFRGKK